MNRPHFAPGDTLYWFDYVLVMIRGAKVSSLTISRTGHIEYTMSDGARLDGYSLTYKTPEAAIASVGTPELQQRRPTKRI